MQILFKYMFKLYCKGSEKKISSKIKSFQELILVCLAIRAQKIDSEISIGRKKQMDFIHHISIITYKNLISIEIIKKDIKNINSCKWKVIVL